MLGEATFYQGWMAKLEPILHLHQTRSLAELFCKLMIHHFFDLNFKYSLQ